MGFASIANTIRSRFNTEFPLVRASVPIHFDNSPKTPPDGPWVRLTILPGESQQTTMGAPTGGEYEFPGMAIVQVFTIAGTMDGEAHEIADDIATIYRGRTVSGVQFTPAPREEHMGVDGKYYQVNVVIPFRAFEVPA